ncbi:hypothetical protein CCH79_00012593 [Gambusia affinis]|uniref:Uncharacterized protein n=1 Tax=Gambusia affinis TaxID=33528 RepID=A0A315VFR4_GAMAF|nr:hypothetical protein CCH79_00012593 [Gambusia affinis]
MKRDKMEVSGTKNVVCDQSNGTSSSQKNILLGCWTDIKKQPDASEYNYLVAVFLRDHPSVDSMQYTRWSAAEVSSAIIPEHQRGCNDTVLRTPAESARENVCKELYFPATVAKQCSSVGSEQKAVTQDSHRRGDSLTEAGRVRGDFSSLSFLHLLPFLTHLPTKMSDEDCRSPIGLDCCSCCLDLANGCDDSLSSSATRSHGTAGALPPSPTSPSVHHFRQLRSQLMYQNLNTDKLNNIMRQDSLESVVRDPCFLLNEGICSSNIDQTMLSILLYFHRVLLMETMSSLYNNKSSQLHTMHPDSAFVEQAALMCQVMVWVGIVHMLKRRHVQQNKVELVPIMCKTYFLVVQRERKKLVKVDGKMDAANYSEVLKANMLQAAGGYFGGGSPSSGVAGHDRAASLRVHL